MKKPDTKNMKIFLSAIFMIIGIGMFYYFLTLPCTTNPINLIDSNIAEASMSMGKEVSTVMCMITDFKGFVFSSLGVIFTFVGGIYFAKNLVN